MTLLIILYVVNWMLGLNFLAHTRARDIETYPDQKDHLTIGDVKVIVLILLVTAIFGGIFIAIVHLMWYAEQRPEGEIRGPLVKFMNFIARPYLTPKSAEDLSIEELESLIKSKKGE